MTLTIEDLAIIYPEQLLLEFSEHEQEIAWQQTQAQTYTNAAARWRAYLNCLCLNAFLTYLQAEPDLSYTPKVWQQETLSNQWQIVNGTAISLEQTRLILIPHTSNENYSELRVPREWVELQRWAGNYYLGVEIDLEKCWLRVWGYATHQQLRQQGKHDSVDESYSLALEDLTEEINTLWINLEFKSQSQPEVKPLPTLSPQAAAALLNLLSQSDLIAPRLSVPFKQWGALLDSGDRWYPELYARQQQSAMVTTQNDQAIAILQWLTGTFTGGWQSLNSLLVKDNLVYSFRSSVSHGMSDRQINVEGVKLIDIGMQLGDRSVALLIGITSEMEDKLSIRVQLHPTAGNSYLPANICLALLSHSGKTLQEFAARSQDELIQLKRFTCKRGKRFRIKVSLNTFSIVEDFLVDLPQNDG
jgi:hypothetical protein